MLIGNLVLNGKVIGFSVEKEDSKYLELIALKPEVMQSIMGVFGTVGNNVIIPYLIGQFTTGQICYFYDCSIVEMGLISKRFLISFSKMLITKDLIVPNFDINLKIESVNLRGKNINFILETFDKRNIKDKECRFVLYNKERELKIKCLIDGITAVSLNCNATSKSNRSLYFKFYIENSHDIYDYFYVADTVEKTLNFCCKLKYKISDEISFDYIVEDELFRKELLLCSKETVNDVVNDPSIIDFSVLNLEDFCKLISCIGNRKNKDMLDLDFLKIFMDNRLNTDFYMSYIKIVQTFENEFNLKYPNFKVDEKIKERLCEVILNSYDAEKLKDENGKPLKESEYNKECESYIRFLELRTTRLSDKIKYMINEHKSLLSQKTLNYFKFETLSKQEINDLAVNLTKNRNSISHGKIYECEITHKTLTLLLGLLEFVYSFYLLESGIDESKIKVIIDRLLLGIILDVQKEKIELCNWKEEYEKQVRELL